jgi:phosphoglycolate phosphatase
MMVKAALFDLDGTLVDSLGDLTDAANHIRTEFNLPELSLDEVRAKVGKGSRNLVQQVLPGVGEADIDRALALFLDYNRQHIAVKSRLYPGVIETLQKLAETGLQMAVITNKNEDLCLLLLEDLGIAGLFSAACGGDTYPERKPSPLPLLSMATQLNVAPQHCLMIGDSCNDIEAGRRAGMRTVGCSWGYGSSAELADADALIHSAEELPVTISRLGGH